jgi:flagellar hook protein FlgE
MNAAAGRLEASARRVAHASVEAPAASVDYAEEAVQQMMARHDFAANAAVMRTHAQMMQSLLDVTV